jgi:hypothetical protein
MELRSLLKFMNWSLEFLKLDKEDQQVLLLSIHKHPDTTEYLINKWIENYIQKSISINAAGLTKHVNEAVLLWNSTPRQIRPFLDSPIRLRMFETLACFESDFTIKQFSDHLKNRGYFASNAAIKILLRILTKRGFLREFQISDQMGPTITRGKPRRVLPILVYEVLQKFEPQWGNLMTPEKNG